MSDDLQIISVIGANGQTLPIQGNSLGSDWISVKPERADESEIREMAAKIKESQKDLTKKQQQQSAQAASRQAAQAANGGLQANLPNGQTNIMNYVHRQPKPMSNGTASNGSNSNSINSNSSVAGNHHSSNNSNHVTNGLTNGLIGGSSSDDKNAKEKPPCDEESVMGHFGWSTFGKVCIPYIYRQTEKYCSVRILEMKLLGKYLNCLHPDIYSSCTCVCSYYITEAEARLFIEINHKHCDGEFGRDIFTQKDLVVRLGDASKFYQFLEICYRKLVSGNKSMSEKCGFIRINKESVVPYTVRNGAQVVPLFYFEGETENLKIKAENLQGWDLAYLKFCCKVQGIRNELFSSESVAVISLTDIKSYFPNGTEFEDYWPSKVVDSNLLIGNRPNTHNSVNWTRHPPAPPPKTAMTSSSNQKSSHSVAQSAVSVAQQQQLMKQRAAAASHNSNANAFNQQAAAAAAAATGHRMLTQATVQALANNSWIPSQGNLPMLHAQMLAQQTHAVANAANRVQYRSPMDNIILSGNRQPYAYSNTAISMSSSNNHNQGNAPPPLVRSAGGQNMSTNDEQALLQKHHQQQQQQQILIQQLQQQQQQQQQRHAVITHPNNTNTQQQFMNSSSNNNNNTTVGKTPTLSLIGSGDSSPGVLPAAGQQQQRNQQHISKTNNNNNINAAAAAAAAAANMNALLSGSFNFNLPSTPADYSNLALWNQLTATQRLLLTQQWKDKSNAAAAAATLMGGGSPTVGAIGPGGSGAGAGSPALSPVNRNNNSSFRLGMSSKAFPPLPSLPLDTDLITMLDYNPNKQQQQKNCNKSTDSSSSSPLAKKGDGSTSGIGGTFTKPNVPALPPPPPLSIAGCDNNRNYSSSSSINSGNNTLVDRERDRDRQQQQQQSPKKRAAATNPAATTQQTLEDFEKKFKMTDEMRAVVQKVLSNPDLSTFIQTNSSNTFVPFISPPISPAIAGSGSSGGGNSGSLGGGGGGSTTLSLVSNPNVTITPQLPAQFLHSPSSSSSSNASTTASPIGSGGVAGAAARQKSVICSIKSSSSSAASLPSNQYYHHHQQHPPKSSSTSSPTSLPQSSSSPVSLYSTSPQRAASNNQQHNQKHQQQQQHHHHHASSLTNSPHSLSSHSSHSHSSHHTQQYPHLQQRQQQQQHPHLQQQQQQISHLQQQQHRFHHQQNTTLPMEVIDLSSSRRSMQGASDYLIQQQAVTQKRLQAVAAHQQNGVRPTTIIERVISSASASVHLQRHAAAVQAGGDNSGSSGGGGGSSSNSSSGGRAQRLSIIPEIPTNNMNVHPYKVQKVFIDKHLVPCINMKAYNDSEQLMALTDFQKYFFPSVGLEHCKRLIEALGVELYKGNRHQIQILMENDRTYNENIPLVQVRDIMKYMPQLTFMTRNPEQPSAKRSRAS